MAWCSVKAHGQLYLLPYIQDTKQCNLGYVIAFACDDNKATWESCK